MYFHVGMQYSWQQFIYTKCQNSNRKPPGSSSTESTEPPPKRPKLENRTLHNYPSIDAELEDEKSNKRNRTWLLDEVQEPNKSTARVKELMRRTFHQLANGSLRRLTQSKQYMKSILC